MQRQRILLIGIGLVLLALLAGAVMSISKKQSATGTLLIQLKITDTTDLTAKLNNKNIALDPQSNNPQTLAPGDYSLTITKPGYKDFSSHFTVVKDQTTQVTVSLTRTTPTPTQPTTPGNKIPDATGVNTDFTIVNSVYFYDKTWAFSTVNLPDGTSAYVVLHYNDNAKAWQTAVEPGTIFPAESVASLPADVLSYMQQNNYILDSGGTQ